MSSSKNVYAGICAWAPSSLFKTVFTTRQTNNISFINFWFKVMNRTTKNLITKKFIYEITSRHKKSNQVLANLKPFTPAWYQTEKMLHWQSQPLSCIHLCYATPFCTWTESLYFNEFIQPAGRWKRGTNERINCDVIRNRIANWQKVVLFCFVTKKFFIS